MYLLLINFLDKKYRIKNLYIYIKNLHHLNIFVLYIIIIYKSYKKKVSKTFNTWICFFSNIFFIDLNVIIDGNEEYIGTGVSNSRVIRKGY